MKSQLLPRELEEGHPPAWLFELLQFVDLKDLDCVIRLNRSWARNLKNWPNFDRLLCIIASNQYRLFCPETLPAGESWKAFFEELRASRSLWALNTDEEVRRFQDPEIRKRDQLVQVFARFRPAALPSSTPEIDDDDDEPSEVKLPLHQRLAFIRLKEGNNTLSTKGALRILQKQGEWFQEEKEQQPLEGQSDSRGQTEQEQGDAEKQRFMFHVHSVNPETRHIMMTVPSIGVRNFFFQAVFPEDTSQQTIFDRVGFKLACDVVNGWNSTIFAYGQTGSGKTHTMYFGRKDFVSEEDGLVTNETGLIPRILATLLQAVEPRRKQQIDMQLSISYVEIYNEKVFDLLQNGQIVPHLSILQRGERKVPISSTQEIFEALNRGEACKSKARTDMNERSTRAHSLIMVSVVQTDLRSQASVESTLFIADLGGSERLGKSKVTGAQLMEAKNINMGLLTLKQVITALNKRSKHVPFLDSKLTTIMADGLGGKSKTRAIMCVNMDPRHAPETLETLRFGEECSLIKTKQASQNLKIVIDMVEEIDSQIKALDEEIRRKEQWETIETRREDILVERGTLEMAVNQKGGELIRTTRLVGAEQEHREIEQLFQKRRSLLGVTHH